MVTVARSFAGLAILSVLAVPAASADPADIEATIRSVLTAQANAWNRGDLPGYLSSVARSEQTRHVFNNEITIGYAAIEARLRSRYPDSSQMGTIAYRDLDVIALAPDAALAFAHWTFEHGDGVFTGVFTLLFRKLDGQWVIVHDHSTAFPGA